jgi:chemotaxis protein histidine kinase CheA
MEMDTEEKTLIDDEQQNIADFIESAKRTISQLKQDLDLVHSDIIGRERINSLFRGFHNLKGGAYGLRLPNIRMITNLVEDILDLTRSNKIMFDRTVYDIFVDSVNQVDGIINNLSEKGIEGESRQEIVERLNKFLEPYKEVMN